MTGFAIDPSALAANAPAYDAHADELASINETLTGKLNAEGTCWGSDDAGKAFEGKYLPTAIKTLEQLQAASGGLHSTGSGLLNWYQNCMTALAEDQSSAASIGT
jgi:uncharacterized protein YukE